MHTQPRERVTTLHRSTAPHPYTSLPPPLTGRVALLFVQHVSSVLINGAPSTDTVVEPPPGRAPYTLAARAIQRTQLRLISNDTRDKRGNFKAEAGHEHVKLFNVLLIASSI